MTSRAFRQALSSLTLSCLWKLQISEVDSNLFISPWFHWLVWPRTAQNMAILIAFIRFESLPEPPSALRPESPDHREVNASLILTPCFTQTPHMATSTPFVHLREGTSLVSLCRYYWRRWEKGEQYEKTGQVCFSKRCRQVSRQQPTSEKKTGGQLAENMNWYASRNNIIRKR